jgi:hypothetical protein
MNIYSKLHGTTSDRFRIGSKNQTMTVTGQTVDASTAILSNRDATNIVASSTVFFTAYVVGQGTTHTAAYEIKGCYISGTNTLSGYVVNTFVDTANFLEPSITFDLNNVLNISVTGVTGDTVMWTSIIDFFIV